MGPTSLNNCSNLSFVVANGKFRTKSVLLFLTCGLAMFTFLMGKTFRSYDNSSSGHFEYRFCDHCPLSDYLDVLSVPKFKGAHPDSGEASE